MSSTFKGIDSPKNPIGFKKSSMYHHTFQATVLYKKRFGFIKFFVIICKIVYFKDLHQVGIILEPASHFFREFLIICLCRIFPMSNSKSRVIKFCALPYTLHRSSKLLNQLNFLVDKNVNIVC